MHATKTASIIIPAYNRAKLLPRAVDSCLTGQPDDLEIIIVDDGSTDKTREIVENYGNRVRYIRESENRGAQHARNVGLQAATSKYIKFLDSDDVLEPESLFKEIQAADREQADIVVSGWGIRDIDGTKTRRTAPEFGQGNAIIDDVLAGKGVFTSAALYRKSYLDQHQLLWDTSIVKLDDWDWFTQAALKLGKIARCDHLSYWQLAHDGPRLTDASMAENAVNHHRILARIEDRVRKLDQLDSKRRKQLAIYYFKELQVLKLHNAEYFERGVQQIERLAPDLDPREGIKHPALAWLAYLFGVRFAMHAYAAIMVFSSR